VKDYLWGPLLEWEFGRVMDMQVKPETKNYLFTHEHVPYHWDGAFHQTPRYLVFQCLQAPQSGCGGETFFCDTVKVWQSAQDAQKQLWKNTTITYKTKKLAHYGGKITQSMVSKHPYTCDTIIRYAEPVSSRLNPVSININHPDQQQFIDNMHSLLYQENHMYTHTWQTGDYLIADNYALLHGRHAFGNLSPRHLRRIQVME